MEQRKIIYQLSLRTFTPEGTLKAATKLLSHVASLGVDIVYLSPFFVEDSDLDESTWSKRQCASGTKNPKNPYKIIDYFGVDEEYGTEEDVKAFVEEAHRVGLEVLFDLVYFHCGRNAVFLKEHPEFVERDKDGNIQISDGWPFPKLNFQSKDLWEYLISHMEMLVTKYHVDGFRCDIADYVTLDFWQEGFRRVKQIYPNLITLNEGAEPSYIEETFDLSYASSWNVLMIEIFGKGKSAAQLKEFHQSEVEKYGKNITKLIRTIDTHDKANDCGKDRNEILMTPRGVEAALVVTNTFDGVPYFWNGYEVCDDMENCMFSNRDYGRKNFINWAKAFTEDGIRRMAFVKQIHGLYHTSNAIREGALQWIEHDAGEEVISYVKKTSDEAVLVLVNSKNKEVSVTLETDMEKILSGSPLMKSGITLTKTGARLQPYGYMIVSIA